MAFESDPESGASPRACQAQGDSCWSGPWAPERFNRDRGRDLFNATFIDHGLGQDQDRIGCFGVIHFGQFHIGTCGAYEFRACDAQWMVLASARGSRWREYRRDTWKLPIASSLCANSPVDRDVHRGSEIAGILATIIPEEPYF